MNEYVEELEEVRRRLRRTADGTEIVLGGLPCKASEDGGFYVLADKDQTFLERIASYFYSLFEGKYDKPLVALGFGSVGFSKPFLDNILDGNFAEQALAEVAEKKLQNSPGAARRLTPEELSGAAYKDGFSAGGLVANVITFTNNVQNEKAQCEREAETQSAHAALVSWLETQVQKRDDELTARTRELSLSQADAGKFKKECDAAIEREKAANTEVARHISARKLAMTIYEEARNKVVERDETIGLLREEIRLGDETITQLTNRVDELERDAAGPRYKLNKVGGLSINKVAKELGIEEHTTTFSGEGLLDTGFIQTHLAELAGSDMKVSNNGKPLTIEFNVNKVINAEERSAFLAQMANGTGEAFVDGEKKFGIKYRSNDTETRSWVVKCFHEIATKIQR